MEESCHPYKLTKMKKRIYYPGAITMTIFFDRRNHINENAKLTLKTNTFEKQFSGYFGDEKQFHSGYTFLGDEILLEFDEFVDPKSTPSEKSNKDEIDEKENQIVKEIVKNNNSNVILIKNDNKRINYNYDEINSSHYWGWGILIFVSGPMYESNETEVVVNHALLNHLKIQDVEIQEKLSTKNLEKIELLGKKDGKSVFTESISNNSEKTSAAVTLASEECSAAVKTTLEECSAAVTNASEEYSAATVAFEECSSSVPLSHLSPANPITSCSIILATADTATTTNGISNNVRSGDDAVISLPTADVYIELSSHLLPVPSPINTEEQAVSHDVVLEAETLSSSVVRAGILNIETSNGLSVPLSFSASVPLPLQVSVAAPDLITYDNRSHNRNQINSSTGRVAVLTDHRPRTRRGRDGDTSEGGLGQGMAARGISDQSLELDLGNGFYEDQDGHRLGEGASGSGSDRDDLSPSSLSPPRMRQVPSSPSLSRSQSPSLSPLRSPVHLLTTAVLTSPLVSPCLSTSLPLNSSLPPIPLPVTASSTLSVLATIVQNSSNLVLSTNFIEKESDGKEKIEILEQKGAISESVEMGIKRFLRIVAENGVLISEGDLRNPHATHMQIEIKWRKSRGDVLSLNNKLLKKLISLKEYSSMDEESYKMIYVISFSYTIKDIDTGECYPFLISIYLYFYLFIYLFINSSISTLLFLSVSPPLTFFFCHFSLCLLLYSFNILSSVFFIFLHKVQSKM